MLLKPKLNMIVFTLTPLLQKLKWKDSLPKPLLRMRKSKRKHAPSPKPLLRKRKPKRKHSLL